jgi:FkbM family methyltransferase
MIKHLFDLSFNGDFNKTAKETGIIIYGAGREGNRLVWQLTGRSCARYNFDISKLLDGIAIYCIADADKEKQGASICKIPVVAPEALSCYDRKTPIIITALDWIPSIMRSLEAMGFENFFGIDAPANDIANQVEKMSKSIRNADELEKNRSEIDAARKLFSEEKSLRVFDARLKRLFEWEIEPLMREFDNNEEQYFPKDIIQLGENEVFVDCGVFDGGSSLSFARNAHDKYNGIYAFEPDETCIPLIKANTAKLANFELYNLGVSDKDSVAYYSGDNAGGGGHVITDNTDASISIKLNSLDNVLLSKPFHPTYIKMDIEGSEIDALNGSIGIIKRDKPRLAICVYHKSTDLWKIPLLINTILPEYHLYLRHHGGINFAKETVLYAIYS